LQRDFDVIGDKDARKLYLKYREALLLFTTTFPIITDKALKYIVNDIDYNEWQKIIDWELVEQRENGYFHYILSLSYLNNILDELGENVPYPNSYFNSNIFLQNNAKIIAQKGCDEIIKIALIPNVIYIHHHKMTFDYDIELIDNLCVVLDLQYNMDCYTIYDNIQEQLLALK
jgi:hypothetical protein